MTQKKLKQGHKQLLELLPLVAFFMGYLIKGIVWATGVLMVATVLVMGLIYAVDRKLSKAQIIGLVLVLFFGGLTVYFNNPAYIVAKVSVINLLFGLVLLVGYFFKRMFIKDLMEEAVTLPEHAWTTLTLRWAGFFFFLAALNLVIYFNFSEKVWATFKLGGLIGLTLVFAFANAPFMAKHMIEKKPDPSADG
jgi:intracellular septation protein